MHQRRIKGESPVRALPALAGAVAIALSLALGAAAQAADAAGAAPQQIATISALSLSGNSAFSDSQLRRAMGISESGWFSRGDDYSKARLAGGLANLRAFYISRGYLRFMVKEVRVTPTPDGKTVAIKITVAEGKLYTLGSVKLAGEAGQMAGTPGVAEALQRALPVGRPVTREGLETARRAIVAQLTYDGGEPASVSSRFTTDDANARIALIFEITRGQPSAQTSPVRPPQEVVPSQPEPAPVAPQTHPVPESRPPVTPPQTGQATAPAAPSQAESTTQPPPAEQKIDETERRELRVGASVGYSSAERLITMANARFLNALGKGRDLAADLAGGKTYRGLRLSESDRWYTPSGVSRSTSLWYRADQPFYYLNHSRFRTSGIGLTERFDIPLTAADSAYLAPGVERDWLRTDGLTPHAYLNHINRAGSSMNVVTLGAGWTHDMRDSASLPTRGYIAQGDVELGLGSTVYIKAYAAGRYYHPLWGDTVLSLSGLGGFGQGFGSKGFPLEKYFYAGGIGSVRGYTGNSLGAHDLGTGFPLGGRRLLTGSIEAIAPLTSFKPDLPGRLVWLLFIDGGNVWSNGLGGTGAGPARFSYGTGLGWQIPFGTLQMSFALPIKRHPGDDYQRFQVEFKAGF